MCNWQILDIKDKGMKRILLCKLHKCQLDHHICMRICLYTMSFEHPTLLMTVRLYNYYVYIACQRHE